MCIMFIWYGSSWQPQRLLQPTTFKQPLRSKLSLQVKLVTPIYYMTKFHHIFIGQKMTLSPGDKHDPLTSIASPQVKIHVNSLLQALTASFLLVSTVWDFGQWESWLFKFFLYKRLNFNTFFSLPLAYLYVNGELIKHRRTNSSDGKDPEPRTHWLPTCASEKSARSPAPARARPRRGGLRGGGDGGGPRAIRSFGGAREPCAERPRRRGMYHTGRWRLKMPAEVEG